VGGTGFLGANLVVHLTQAGHTPVVVARRPERARALFPGLEIEARYGDLADPVSLRQALAGSACVHSVAGVVGGVFTSPNPRLREAAVRVNVEGTLNVLCAARETRARRVVWTSSCATRYQPRGLLAREDSPVVDPMVGRDPYVRSKLLAEQAILAVSRSTGMTTAAILPGGMIGPRDSGPAPLGAALLSRLNGDREGVVGLEGAFPVVDVRDVAEAHIAAMGVEDPRTAYLVVADTIATRDWYEMFSRVSGIPNDVRIVPGSVARPMALAMEAMAWIHRRRATFNRHAVRHVLQRQQFDCTLARQELGIRFTALETSLRDAVRWYADAGMITDDARLAIVRSALERAAYDAAPSPVSPRRSAAQA
jgi:dihydroflavonol-4-reductase